jgi:hypothetical protein
MEIRVGGGVFGGDGEVDWRGGGIDCVGGWDA